MKKNLKKSFFGGSEEGAVEMFKKIDQIKNLKIILLLKIDI